MSKAQTGGTNQGGHKGTSNNNGGAGKGFPGWPSGNRGMPSGTGRANNPPAVKR